MSNNEDSSARPQRIGEGWRIYCTSDKNFRKELLQFLKGHIKSKSSVDGMDWTCLERAEEHFADYLKNPHLSSVFLEVVFGMFEDFRLTDSFLVQRWLAEYSKRRIRRYGYIPVNSKACFYRDARQANGSFRLIEVPTYERLMKPCPVYELLSKPFIYQDFQCMKRLLRYSVPLTYESRNLHYLLGELFLHFEGDPALSEAVFYNVTCRRDDENKRLKLLLMAVDFVVQKRMKKPYSGNCIKSLRLLFEAIPDAFITRREVQRFLRLIILTAIGEGVQSIIEDFCRSFVKLFPESAEPPRPRSMQHLARCEIRKCLFLSGNLPHGVHHLAFPKRLKNYILLQTDAKEFHPRYDAVSARKNRFFLKISEFPPENLSGENPPNPSG